MKKSDKIQELAIFLRSAAYADNQSHSIDWSLSVIHPTTNEGDMGYSGGLWTHERTRPIKCPVSLSFSYSKSKGIHNVQAWKDKCKIRDDNKRMSFEAFQQLVITLFQIEVLYQK